MTHLLEIGVKTGILKNG